MILFDLKCHKDHVFEAWFRDSRAYESQAKAGKIVCPVCASSKVGKALMAPSIASSRQKAKTGAAAQAQAQAEVRQMLLELREQVEKNCEYVGPQFAEEARKIHYGETDPRGIYGEASEQETAELIEEGIEIGRIPWIPRSDG
ncbi:MAG: DUF1178 family protein [Alphaproteobacteria bacterium]|nr:DUF1178 family protein [Alphaproteobacteria bacterium]